MSFDKKILIETINSSGKITTREDCVIKEERIAFYLNQKKLLSVMSIPKEQDCHIVGFLMSEGVLTSIEEIKSIEISQEGDKVFLQAQINEEQLKNLFVEKTLTSGCCVGVAGNLEGNVMQRFVQTPLLVSAKKLFYYLKIFEQPSELFTLTGCVHKAMLVLEEEMLISEDIGRHNAIDKVMGKAKLQNLDTTHSILYVSGRLSLEMVVKAVMHNVPIVISKAAPTYLGIRAAQETGVTLIGFARGESANIYTHSGRIKDC